SCAGLPGPASAQPDGRLQPELVAPSGLPTESRSASLPQRILVKHKTTVRVVSRCRIRTSSFRKGELLHSPSMQQPREAKISFDAARLGIKSVVLVALPSELLADGPRLRPHRRVLDGHHVFKRGRGDARPALDHMQVLP